MGYYEELKYYVVDYGKDSNLVIYKWSRVEDLKYYTIPIKSVCDLGLPDATVTITPGVYITIFIHYLGSLFLYYLPLEIALGMEFCHPTRGKFSLDSILPYITDNPEHQKDIRDLIDRNKHRFNREYFEKIPLSDWSDTLGL